MSALFLETAKTITFSQMFFMMVALFYLSRDWDDIALTEICQTYFCVSLTTFAVSFWLLETLGDRGPGPGPGHGQVVPRPGQDPGPAGQLCPALTINALNIFSVFSIVRGQYWRISNSSRNRDTLSFMFCPQNRRNRVFPYHSWLKEPELNGQPRWC